MPFLKTTSLVQSVASPFKQVDMVRDIIVSGDAYNPLDNDSPETYTILAGTPMAPKDTTTGKYMPIRRTLLTAITENAVTLTVANTEPFRAGDVVLLYTALNKTADSRTVSSVASATSIILTAVATVATNDRLEVGVNGAHGNTTAALTDSTMYLQDAVLLLNDVCVYHASDGTTFDTPAVGVIRGQIAAHKVVSLGPGTAAFDTDLEYQVPGIDFVPLTAGTG